MVGVGMDQLDKPSKAITHVSFRLLRKDAAEIPWSEKRGGVLFRAAAIGDPPEEKHATADAPIDIDDSDEDGDY